MARNVWAKWIVSKCISDWKLNIECLTRLSTAASFDHLYIPERGEPPTPKETSLYVMTLPLGILNTKSYTAHWCEVKRWKQSSFRKEVLVY